MHMSEIINIDLNDKKGGNGYLGIYQSHEDMQIDADGTIRFSERYLAIYKKRFACVGIGMSQIKTEKDYHDAMVQSQDNFLHSMFDYSDQLEDKGQSILAELLTALFTEETDSEAYIRATRRLQTYDRLTIIK